MNETPEFDIVELYKKGYSIDYIIESYYRYKTKYDLPNIQKNNLIILRKKSISKEDSKKKVYEEIYNYIK